MSFATDADDYDGKRIVVLFKTIYTTDPKTVRAIYNDACKPGEVPEDVRIVSYADDVDPDGANVAYLADCHLPIDDTLWQMFKAEGFPDELYRFIDCLATYIKRIATQAIEAEQIRDVEYEAAKKKEEKAAHTSLQRTINKLVKKGVLEQIPKRRTKAA